MNEVVRIPKLFRDLFIPNRTQEQRRKFTPEYKAGLRRRLLSGEAVDPKEFGVKEIILKGGRISGKTMNDEEAALLDLLDPEIGDIWYCRSEENTIRRSIFQSMQATIARHGFSISNKSNTDFKVSYSPFEIKCNLTGNTCQFFSINRDINRTKGHFPPSGRLKRVMLEEANEPDGREYVEALKSTALRFMDEMGKIVYRYNPPPSLAHWANVYFPVERVNAGAEMIHSTWEDIVEFLDPVIISEIIKMRAEDPVHYAYWYGGEVVSLEGLVIWSFDRKKHVIPLADIQKKIVRNIYFQPIQMFYGVDSGLKQDASVISAWALFPDSRLIKLSTFYLDIRAWRRKTGEKGISHTDQVVMMIDWYNNFKKRMGDYGISIPSPEKERWCFDGAAMTQDLMFEFEKATHFLTTAVTDKDVERDNARLINGYRSGMMYFLALPDNEPSIKEYETFARDENNEIPEGQSDHSIDADKYATYEYYYNFL